jgi:hypothetical protein
MKSGLEHSWGTRPLGQPWHSIALAAVGLLLVSAAIYFYWSTSNFLQSSAEAQGIVTDIVLRGNHYYPVFQFSTLDSGDYTVHSSTGAHPPRFSINERVTVVYEPNNPAQARIKEFWSLWLFPVIFGVLGPAFILGAIILWVYRRAIFTMAGYPDLAEPDNSLRRLRDEDRAAQPGRQARF